MEEILEKLTRDQKKRYNYYSSHLSRHCQAQFGLIADPNGVLNRLTDKDLDKCGMTTFIKLPLQKVGAAQSITLLEDVQRDGLRVPDIATTASLIGLKQDNGTFAVPRYTRIGLQREGTYADMRKHGANRRVATLVHGAAFHYVLSDKGTSFVTPLLAHAFVKRLSENAKLLNDLLGVSIKTDSVADGRQAKPSSRGKEEQAKPVEVDHKAVILRELGNCVASDLVAAHTFAALTGIASKLEIEGKFRNKLQISKAIIDCLKEGTE